MLFGNSMGRAELGVPLREYRRKVPPLPKNYNSRVKEVESWPDYVLYLVLLEGRGQHKIKVNNCTCFTGNWTLS